MTPPQIRPLHLKHFWWDTPSRYPRNRSASWRSPLGLTNPTVSKRFADIPPPRCLANPPRNGSCPKIHKHQPPKTQVQEVHFHGSPISSTHGPSNSHSIPQLNISWKVSVWFSYWVVGMWFHDPGSLHIANQLNIGVLRPRCLFICDVIPSQHSVDRLRFFKLQIFPNFLPKSYMVFLRPPY